MLQDLHNLLSHYPPPLAVPRSVSGAALLSFSVWTDRHLVLFSAVFANTNIATIMI